MIRVGPFPTNMIGVHLESFDGQVIEFQKEFDFDVSGCVERNIDGGEYRGNINIRSKDSNQDNGSKPKAEIDLSMESDSAVELAKKILVHCGTQEDLEDLESRVGEKPPIQRFIEEEDQE